MKRSILYTILWFIFLIVLGLLSLFASRTIKQYPVSVGPHLTYTWYQGSSNLLGDGKNHLYLKSDSGNFTIYDENGIFVASGVPVKMQPGDTKQAFTSDFPLELGKKYYLSDNNVDAFTLNQTNLQFESRRYGYNAITAIAVIMLILSLGLL